MSAMQQQRRPVRADLPLHPYVVDQLKAELQMAHEIIQIALNTLDGEQKRLFVQRVCDSGLDGEGVTRHHERALVLMRAGVRP